jgi:hypothetical protein
MSRSRAARDDSADVDRAGAVPGLHGPITRYEQVVALLGGSSGAAIVAREWITQRAETQRERRRQDRMTQRALLTGSPEESPNPDLVPTILVLAIVGDLAIRRLACPYPGSPHPARALPKAE